MPDMNHISHHAPPAVLGSAGLVIGFVNLMPKTALRTTEMQFRALLQGALDQPVRLRRFALAPAPEAIADGYEDLNEIWSASLDGMIVTGMEPQASTMTAEPVWPALARLVDWAGEHAISVLWSCFAAHAAVFRLDGIPRQRLGQKLSGIFACQKVSGHGIVAAAPARWHVPHSRHNTLSEAALVDHGYTILSRGPDIGADSFLKPYKSSLFLFLQGHPEYRPETLRGEYLRDLRRFLTGASQRFPDVPANCYSAKLRAALQTVQNLALRDPAAIRLLELEALLPAPPDVWKLPAQRLAGGWLGYVAAQKIGGAA